MSITLQEIKNAACGIDADGHSKALSIVGAHKYNMANTALDPQVIAEFSSIEPVISISVGGEITWISMKFISAESRNLGLYFRALERYLEEVDANTDELQAAAFVSIMPIELAGQYYINAVHPIMWAIEPEAVGEDFRTLRVAFFSEDVAFLESDLDEDFFDKAMVAAEQDVEEIRAPQTLDTSERDDEFTNANKYISDLADDEDINEDDDDETDSEKDDEDGENHDRSSYVYH